MVFWFFNRENSSTISVGPFTWLLVLNCHSTYNRSRFVVTEVSTFKNYTAYSLDTPVIHRRWCPTRHRWLLTKRALTMIINAKRHTFRALNLCFCILVMCTSINLYNRFVNYAYYLSTLLFTSRSMSTQNCSYLCT